MAARGVLRTCLRFQQNRNGALNLLHSSNRVPRLCIAGRCLSTASHPSSPVKDNVWASPHPDVELPEEDLTRFLLKNFPKHADQRALVDSATGQELTFAQLQTQITRAASALSRMGIQQGDMVTLFMPNCVEFPVMFLAITALGAVASAVNPLYTAGELKHALNVAKSKLIVTVPALLEVSRQVARESPTLQHMICTEPAEGCRSVASLLEDDGGAFPDHVDISPRDHMASLLFSSGTTGLPKGVMLSHFNLVSNLQQMSSPLLVNYPEDACISAVLPFFHIFGLNVVLLLSLKLGRPSALLPKFDPETYLKSIQDNRCTHLYVVPPMVLFLAQHPLVEKYDLSSVRSVLSGAAPVNHDLCLKLKERLNKPDLFIRQGYGMTETCPMTHCDTELNTKPNSVGLVAPSTFSKVVDLETGAALPPFQEGEVCSKGPQVMMGYYQNEAETAATIDKDGWIHSGDLGYVDEEGYFYVTDRLKELIKYKANQVAPAELESVLFDHPNIMDAAVIGIPDEKAGELPRAYVVLKPGTTMTEEQVAQHVKDNVAPYKQLFGGVDFRSAIPRSATGKVLRRILKDEFLRNL